MYIFDYSYLLYVYTLQSIIFEEIKNVSNLNKYRLEVTNLSTILFHKQNYFQSNQDVYLVRYQMYYLALYLPVVELCVVGLDCGPVDLPLVRMVRVPDDLVQLGHVRVGHGQQDAHQEAVEHVGLKLLHKLGPAEVEHVRVDAEVGERDAQRLCKGLHHLDQVEAAHEAVRAREEQHGQVLGDPAVGDVLGVDQGRFDRLGVWITRSVLLF